MNSFSRALGRIGGGRLWRTLSVAGPVLLLAALLGAYASRRLLLLIAGGVGGLALLQRPVLGLHALVIVALVVPLELGTGTEVTLTPATLLVPGLFGLWLLDSMGRKDLRLAPSRTNKPLLLFLLAGLLSLGVGHVLWDPVVPRSSNFLLVQLAQWAIFAFSAFAFWLVGDIVRDEAWLGRLTWTFLALAGSLAILWMLPSFRTWVNSITAIFSLTRAPFWTLLAALAGGQLLFNRALGQGQRLFLLTVLGAVLYCAFVVQRQRISDWLGVAAVAGVLFWSRFPRLRWLVVGLLALLAVAGLLVPIVYEFAGGEDEWIMSGRPRLALIGRVIEVTMRNPITGLGPAAYRSYAGAKPLTYRHIQWWNPNISSHNNYVDLFAHTGLLGLGLFLWFMVEVGLLGMRLRARLKEGFGAGYVNGMLAAGAGAIVIMMLADWILPFVYNVGFPGFPVSVLVWLFLGGLVAVERMGAASRSLYQEDKER
jgi:ABC-type multidrug transport system fused ATPase/permease subunit